MRILALYAKIKYEYKLLFNTKIEPSKLNEILRLAFIRTIVRAGFSYEFGEK